jgi:uncharacterized protein YutE (UPF0331/DUF86 family)
LVDRHVVQARIGKLREYLTLLRKIRGLASEARFVRDPLIYGNAERYLQLAIQAVLDISNHVVADTDSRLPSDNKELFQVLATRKIISAALARRLVSMAGRRNILVHATGKRGASAPSSIACSDARPSASRSNGRSFDTKTSILNIVAR